MFGEGTKAESILVLRVEPLVTPFVTSLVVDNATDDLILLPRPAALSIGLAIPFSSNGG